MISRAVSLAFIAAFATPALAQSLKPISIECTTDGKALSAIESNPNRSEAHCEYSCSYTAKDKQQHQTHTARAVIKPGTSTFAMGRVDGDPPYAGVSVTGFCTGWKCQTASNAKLLCNER
jgi:hypothetical protein